MTSFLSAEDIADLQEIMRDELTVEVTSVGELDPNTGAGTTASREVIRQPCSDQDVTLRERSRYLVDGVAGSLPVSRCYTTWFPWPETAPGEFVTVKVNGKVRPLMRQGPPADIGGQHALYVLELDKPVGGDSL